MQIAVSPNATKESKHWLVHLFTQPLKNSYYGFPGGSVAKNLLQCRGLGFNPWSQIPHAMGNSACAPQLLKPVCPRACTSQLEKA